MKYFDRIVDVEASRSTADVSENELVFGLFIVQFVAGGWRRILY